MDTFEALRLFVSIADAGSLSGAARLESVATSTVTVALQQLEERAGASLITRSTRRLALTHEGEQFLEDARSLLSSWDAAVMGVQDGTLKGPIKITAAGEFSRKVLVPIVDRFVLQHPGVQVTVHGTDEVVEMVDHRIDIALRGGPLVDSTLKTRLLLRGGGVLCASPVYWAERDTPQHPEELTQHNCLIHSRPDIPYATWTFRVDGKPTSVRVRGDRSANDNESLRYWALAGRGIIRRHAWGIQNDLRSGALVSALDAFADDDFSNLYAVTTTGMLSQRVSKFIDFLAHELQTMERPGY